MNPINDNTYEGTENVTFKVTGNSNYNLGSTTQGNAWIYDNDTPPKSTVTVTTTDSVAQETNWWETPNPAKFTINRTGGDNTKAETVYYSVTGTAKNGQDYTALAGVATIPAGASSTVVTVNPINDNTYEGTENVTFKVTGNSNYNLGSTTQGNAWIYDNDLPPTAPTLVGVTWTGEFYEVDLESKEINRIGSTSFDKLNALTSDSQGNLLTIASVDSPIGEVIRINPSTGVGEVFATFQNDFEGKKASIRGLTSAGDNTLYAIHNLSGNGLSGRDSLYRIDLSTGQAAKISDLAYSSLQSLAMSPSGMLYSFDKVSGALIRINPITGQSTEIQATDIPPYPANTIQGLTFTPEGDLYAIFQLNSSTRTGWYKVDVNSGVLTPTQLEGNVSFRGIAFPSQPVNSTPPALGTPTNPVPAPGSTPPPIGVVPTVPSVPTIGAPVNTAPAPGSMPPSAPPLPTTGTGAIGVVQISARSL